MFSHSATPPRTSPQISLTALLIMTLGAAVSAGNAAWADSAPATTVFIDAAPSLVDEALTGRIFLLVSRQLDKEPRLSFPATYVYYFDDPQMPYPALFSEDVDAWNGKRSLTLGGVSTLGYPYSNLAQLPPGEYAIQAVFNRYTRVTRSDGHTLWVHLDRGEGQQFQTAPGNLISEPVRVRLGPDNRAALHLTLTRVIPPIEPQRDTAHLKYIRHKSELVSRFWGHEMDFGVTVLLPDGYETHPDVYYPMVIHQGHFDEGAPLGFTEELPADPGPNAGMIQREDYEQSRALYGAWFSPSMPRLILVSIQHVTPYYDDSYFVNSANNGPWRDAFFQEILPLLLKNFRIIPAPYAHVMFGGSTGGWVSAALQIQHPDEFGGAWIFAPDFVDLREFLNVDLYSDKWAFNPPGYQWRAPERYMSRSPSGQARVTVREFSRLTAVLGSRGRSGEFLDMWSAVAGPTDADGYPRQIWDLSTGNVDHDVVEYWRKHDMDLREFLARNWANYGPRLAGKLHFATGDMDNFFVNLAMYRMQEFLESAHDPKFSGTMIFSPRTGHDWSVGASRYSPWPRAILEDMASEIASHTPKKDQPIRWKYSK